MEKLDQPVNPAKPPHTGGSQRSAGIFVNDEQRYLTLTRQQEAEWENKCGRCGACCGAYDGDPCIHLRQSADKKYFCSIYSTRFGPQQTVKGNTINCVPIRHILHTSWPGDHCCGYKK